MEYTIVKQTDIETVVVKASGLINSTVAAKMAIDAGIIIRSSGFQRCLFDLTDTQIDPNQTMTGMYLFVEKFKMAGIDKKTRIAGLQRATSEHRRQLEKAASFEGFNLKYFTDKSEAIRWLSED